MDRVHGTLVVTPDNTTPGSEGRLHLDLPRGLSFMAGWKLKVFGRFGVDKVVMMVRGDEGLSVTPKLQVWWKNGVRDHEIRENWHVHIYIIENDILVAILVRPTGQQPPKLPPYQPKLF
jgi:hypothetical protein